MAAELASNLKLEVATPKGLAIDTDAESVQAPSVDGELGVLPGHLPLLAALQCGVLRYLEGGRAHVAAIGLGFVEAEPDKVRVLTQRFALPKDIDPERVRAELVAAEAKLKAFAERHEGPVYEELRDDVAWANARLTAHAVENP
jgi:F-type H+-transporting ATPase subunit epsilon